MKNGLYKVHLVSSFPSNPDADTTNLPEADVIAMITDKDGVFFAKLHPVKITAKPKAECAHCQQFKNLFIHTINGPSVYVKYCPNCGQKLWVTV